MTINEKLDLMVLSEDFEIKKATNGVLVEVKDICLKACIDNNTFNISYYATVPYGEDIVEIDMEGLKKLKEFCELLIQD